MAHTKKGSVNPRFEVGDRVRVKPGVSDPFFTSYWAKSGPFSSKKVTVPISRLDPPVDDEFDEEAGLYGIGHDQDEEIEFPLEVIELKKKDANYRLISDYTYWSRNWR